MTFAGAKCLSCHPTHSNKALKDFSDISSVQDHDFGPSAVIDRNNHGCS